MSHVIRYHVSLTCSHCGTVNDARTIQLYTSSFGQDPFDVEASPGMVLELALVDFEDGFFTLRLPRDDEDTVIAIELWGCGTCNAVQRARLAFERAGPEHYRFVGATVVALTSEVLDEAHFMSRKLYDWSPSPGDDVARVQELVDRFL